MEVSLAGFFDLGDDLNEKMVDIILRAIKEKHESGIDYLRFKQSVKNLIEMNMDEPTAFKTAFATASALGLNKMDLLASVSAYKGVIDAERDKFIETLKKQIENLVEEPKAEVEKTNQMIASHHLEIEQLQAEINAMKARIAGLETAISAGEEKIEKTRKEFLSVYESFINSLEEDRNYFESLLS